MNRINYLLGSLQVRVKRIFIQDWIITAGLGLNKIVNQLLQYTSTLQITIYIDHLPPSILENSIGWDIG